MLRWYAKKGARTAVTLATWLGGGLESAGGRGGPWLRVLTYHRFGEARHDPFCVHPADFAAQMQWIAERGLGLTLAELETAVVERRPPARSGLLVTIDDGYRSLLDVALPVLARHPRPAVAFVPAGEVGTRAPTDPEARLGWPELRELVAAGVDVGSHSWTHESLGRMSAAETRMQTARSRAVLEDRLGRQVTAFAYPFGTRADYRAESGQILRETGYRCAFTARAGRADPGCDPFALPRVKVEGGEPGWMFGLLARGGLDPWRHLDPWVQPFQNRPRPARPATAGAPPA